MTIPAPNGRQNIHKVYALSTQIERQDGYQYYRRLFNCLDQLGRKYTPEIAPGVLAGAFAALSPNLDEVNNWIAIRQCVKVVRGELPPDTPYPGYSRNRRKAESIIRAGTVEEVLTGPKVEAFYRNIINPLDCTPFAPVTVDGHMHNIWYGEPRLLRGVRVLAGQDTTLMDASIRNVKHYDIIAKDFRAVAGCFGIPVAPFQAILWLTWKRIHNIRYTPPQALLQFDRWEFPVWNGSQKL